MYQESKISLLPGIIIIAGAFVLLFGVWVIFPRELFRDEALYAAQAAEFSLGNRNVTVHGVSFLNAYPIYPALTSFMYRICRLPMESSLRLITVSFIALGTLLSFAAAANGRNIRAGLVAAAMYCSSMMMLDNGMEGHPGTLGAFFLLAAQMSFFYLGLRNGKWNLAWLSSGVLLTAGFLSSGVLVLVLFILPMLFFIRIIASRTKYANPGFAGAAVLVLGTLIYITILSWSVERNSSWGNFIFLSGISIKEYLRDFLFYWLQLPLRFLPWSLIAWLPFCVALQRLDTKPLFSKYLRTIALSSAILLWLTPKLESRELLYLAGPLAILCGIYYELGMKRYGEKLRRSAPAAEYCGLVTIIMIFGGLLLNDELLHKCFSLRNSLNFRNTADIWFTAIPAAAGILAVVLLLRIFRKKMPIWIVLLSLSLFAGTFAGTLLLHYRAQSTPKIQLGKLINQVISSDTGKPADSSITVYKSGITGLYGELFYSGVKTIWLPSEDELPDGNDNTVYLLSTRYPQNPKWSWNNMLPDYRYQQHHLMLWRGRRNSTQKLPPK